MNKSTKKTKTVQKFALLNADPTLKEPVVLDTMCLVPELAKKIEPVGKFYAELQHKRMFGV